jgi:hypothetical protein
MRLKDARSAIARALVVVLVLQPWLLAASADAKLIAVQ